MTAAAATWDTLHNLGSATLDKAVIVKLTRTLAIIPITMGLAYLNGRKKSVEGGKSKFSLRKAFPSFILYFVLASLITTILGGMGVASSFFTPFKTASKFLIVMAMGAIGLNTDVVKLLKTGGKPLLMGFACWVGITVVSLLMQHLMKLW